MLIFETDKQTHSSDAANFGIIAMSQRTISRTNRGDIDFTGGPEVGVGLFKLVVGAVNFAIENFLFLPKDYR